MGFGGGRKPERLEESHADIKRTGRNHTETQKLTCDTGIVKHEVPLKILIQSFKCKFVITHLFIAIFFIRDITNLLTCKL